MQQKHYILLLLAVIALAASCTGRSVRRMHSFYARALRMEEAGRNDSAVVYYRTAIDAARLAGEDSLAGVMYNRLGDVFLTEDLDEKACEAFSAGARLNEGKTDKSDLSRSLRGMGKSHVFRLHPADSSLRYFLRAQSLEPFIADSHERMLVHDNLAAIYSYTELYDSAFFHNSLALQMSTDSADIYRSLFVKGNIFRFLHEYDSALFYYKMSAQTDAIENKIGCYLLLSRVTASLGMADSSRYAKMFNVLRDSMERMSRTVEVQDVDNSYAASVSERRYGVVTAAAVAVVAAVAAAVFFLLRLRHRRRLSALDSEMRVSLTARFAEIERLQAELACTRDNDGYREKYEHLTRLQQASTDNIVHVAADCLDKFVRTKAWKELQQCMERDSMDGVDAGALFRAAGRSFAPFVLYLQTFLSVSEDDCLLCCLSLAGVCPRHVAALRNVSWEAVRVQKSRLKKKMADSFCSSTLYDYIFAR